MSFFACIVKYYILTSDSVVVRTTQSTAQFGWELLVTASASRAFVIFVEFTSGTQWCIANGAGKMMYTPCFVQCRENITSNDLVAHIAQISKQLMVMLLAVGKSLLLVMAMTMEWLLTFGTYEVLNMPMLSKGSDNSLLDRTSASSANGDTHLVMATEAEEIVHIIGSISRAMFDFSSCMIQFYSACGTCEVVAMIHLATVTQRFAVDHAMALMAHVIQQPISLDASIASMAESTPTIFNKTCVGQLHITFLTTEACRVPVGIHCFNHTANYEFPTFSAARSKQHLEVSFTVLTSFKLVEYAFGKHTEALCTHKAVGMPKFSV